MTATFGMSVTNTYKHLPQGIPCYANSMPMLCLQGKGIFAQATGQNKKYWHIDVELQVLLRISGSLSWSETIRIVHHMSHGPVIP